ncbi:MAG: N-acetylneuraminate synthase, partial [Elusimicrobia bacterium]|nr:N-acetylneuraminate synthase [Elusimicrobiota bacterium]
MNNIFIIGEAGVNHNGRLRIAKKMIDAACNAGVNAVKFQTFTAEYVMTKNAPKALYQKKNTGKRESQFAMIKKLELNLNAHKELIHYCRKKNIMFLSSAFDLKSIELLHKLGVSVFKIPSGEIT